MNSILLWAVRAGGAAVIVAWLPVSGYGQRRHDPANVVPKSDPMYAVLTEYRTALQQREAKERQIRSKFYDWINVESPAAARLFPNLRFAALRWDMERHPDYQGPLSLAQGLEMVVAIDAVTMRQVRELWVYNNHGEFGKLLIDYHATLRNAEEAKLVWDASCDIYGQGSKTAPMKRMSDAEWRFGFSSYDQTTSVVDGFKTVVTKTHYTQALVDPKTGRITSWGAKVDSSNRRKVPTQ